MSAARRGALLDEVRRNKTSDVCVTLEPTAKRRRDEDQLDKRLPTAEMKGRTKQSPDDSPPPSSAITGTAYLSRLLIVEPIVDAGPIKGTEGAILK